MVFSLAVPVVFFALARYRLPLEMALVVGAAVLLAHHSSRSGDPAVNVQQPLSGGRLNYMYVS